MCTETGCTHEVNNAQNVETPVLEPAQELVNPTTELNEWGCACGPEDLCELCSEVIDVEYVVDEDGGEEKKYPHISEFKYPLTKPETISTFRNFISRVSR